MPTKNFPADGLQTERLMLRLTRSADADNAALLKYYQRNRQHLQPWEPLRAADFYTNLGIQQHLQHLEKQMQEGNALFLFFFAKEDGMLIGRCGLTNFVRGAFQACHLGYSLGEEYQGKGLMQEALTRVIDHVFAVEKLHRIMANYSPDNVRSGNLLKRLGFEIEGRARAYLKTNGVWTDSMLTSLINDAV